MTLPCERYNSLRYTEKFLLDLCDPKKTPRVSREVRNRARSCLRHYPREYDLDVISSKCPEVIQSGNELDDLTIMIHDYETRKNNGS